MDQYGRMVMHIPSFKIITTASVLFSFLDVDCDQRAERIQIFDRKTGAILRHLPIKLGKNIRIILPPSYSIAPTLMCIILDDNDEFSASIIDRVQAKLINIFQFDINNQSSYEPPA